MTLEQIPAEQWTEVSQSLTEAVAQFQVIFEAMAEIVRQVTAALVECWDSAWRKVLYYRLGRYLPDRLAAWIAGHMPQSWLFRWALRQLMPEPQP